VRSRPPEGVPILGLVHDDDVSVAAPWLPDDLRIRPMTAQDAEVVATWRYGGPAAVYDVASAQPILDDLPDYLAVTAGERLVGFCCVGRAARVPGLSEHVGVLDVGFGMEPGLVGHGRGTRFGRAMLAFLATAFPHQELRAVVQDWNERSLRLTRRLGFQDAGALTVAQGGRPVTYRIVTRPR